MNTFRDNSSKHSNQSRCDFTQSNRPSWNRNISIGFHPKFTNVYRIPQDSIGFSKYRQDSMKIDWVSIGFYPDTVTYSQMRKKSRKNFKNPTVRIIYSISDISGDDPQTLSVRRFFEKTGPKSGFSGSKKIANRLGRRRNMCRYVLRGLGQNLDQK